MVASPTFVAREEFHLEVAKLATKEELRAEVAKLATKEELRSEVSRLESKIEDFRDDVKRPFDVVAESLRDDIRLLAEGQASMAGRMDQMYAELTSKDADLDRRVTRVEAAQRRRPPNRH